MFTVELPSFPFYFEVVSKILEEEQKSLTWFVTVLRKTDVITEKIKITLSVDLVGALGSLSVQIPCHGWCKLYTEKLNKKNTFCSKQCTMYSS